VREAQGEGLAEQRWFFIHHTSGRGHSREAPPVAAQLAEALGLTAPTDTAETATDTLLDALLILLEPRVTCGGFTTVR